jgi:hypothetical protein
MSSSRLKLLNAPANGLLYTTGLVLVICGLLSLTLRLNPDIHMPPNAEQQGYSSIGTEEATGLLEGFQNGNNFNFIDIHHNHQHQAREPANSSSRLMSSSINTKGGSLNTSTPVANTNTRDKVYAGMEFDEEGHH